MKKVFDFNLFSIKNPVDFKEEMRQFLPNQSQKMEEEFVFQYQDEMDYNGDNLLHVAIKRKWKDITTQCILKKLGLNSRGEDNLTSLDLAYMDRDRNLICQLRDNGASKFKITNSLHYACFDGDYAKVVFLLDDGWDATSWDENKCEPLAWAANEIIAKELIFRRGNAKYQNSEKNTALHYLVTEKNLSPERIEEVKGLIDFLMENGLRVNTKNKQKKKASELAACPQIKEFLFEKEKDKNGRRRR